MKIFQKVGGRLFLCSDIVLPRDTYNLDTSYRLTLARVARTQKKRTCCLLLSKLCFNPVRDRDVVRLAMHWAIMNKERVDRTVENTKHFVQQSVVATKCCYTVSYTYHQGATTFTANFFRSIQKVYCTPETLSNSLLVCM